MSVYLFSQLHFDTRSNRLLSKLSFSLKWHITSFSKKKRLHDFDTIQYSEGFFKMDHLISKYFFSSFKPQIYFETSVLFSCVRFLNDIVWLLYLDLNSVSQIPKYTLVDNSLMPLMVSISAL